MKGAAVVVALGLLAGVARAEDDKKNSVTVLPWTNASLVFGTSAKNGVVEYAHLSEVSRLILYLKASAPLDQDTRIAAFTSGVGLARGFSASFQVGVDGRTDALRALRARYQASVKALAGLLAIKAEEMNEAQAYASRHGLKTNDDAIARSLCGAGECTPRLVAAAVCKRLAALASSTTCVDEAGASRVAGEVVSGWCSPVPADANGEWLDRCFVARFWRHKMDQEATYQTVRGFAGSKDLVDDLWKVLELADQKTADDLLARYGTAGKAQALLDERKIVQDAFKELLHGTELERRDLLITGIGGHRSATAVTLDGGFSYDRLAVYQDDLASLAQTNVKYDLSLGGTVTYFPGWATGLAGTLRAGFERTLDPAASRTERCVARASTDATVTGKSCDPNTLFRAGDAPGAASAMYVRAAISYQYAGVHSEDDLVPGVELRGALEGLGASKTVGGRLTLFGTPIAGAAAARVGVALDVAYAIDPVPAVSRWVVTPLIFVGASFAGLMAAR